MISGGMNLVLTVIGFAVSVMFIVFVCTRLICARIHLRRSAFPDSFSNTAAAARSNSSDLSLLERGLHGLEPVVVASFATKKFGDEFFRSTQDTQCTICLTEYQEKDVLRVLPFCRHYFHVNCIDIWLKQHSTCPVCRISLRDSPNRKRILQSISSPPVRSIYNPHITNSETFQFLSTIPRHTSGAADDQEKENANLQQVISEPSGSSVATTFYVLESSDKVSATVVP